MATTCFFEETIIDQGQRESLRVEIGRSSYYSRSQLPSGVGEDSIYLSVDGTTVVMTRAMAQKLVDAVISVGQYHNLC